MLAPVLLTAVLAAANPFTLSPSPAPAPSSSPSWQLPEIGRVRSTTPACAVMRDLIAPSFAASLRADAQFAKIRKSFSKYVSIVDDASTRNTGYHAMALARLDHDAQTMREEALVLNRALGDPRFAHPTDPQVVAEKRELQQLYDTQSGRANMIWEFVMRERAGTMRSGMGTMGEAAGALPALPESTTAPFGMPPPLRGIELTDKHLLDEWAGDITVQIRASEHHMADALLPVSTSCR